MNWVDIFLDNMSAFVALLGVIVTLITFAIATEISNKREFIKTFDKVYKTTFSLRVSISKNKDLPNKTGGFHYEIDTILNNKKIEAIVLDYLTEIENLSLILLKKKNISKIGIRTFSYSKLFKRLSSSELYKRMLCLYPYITYKRKHTDNYQLFSNYTDLLMKIESCEQKKNKKSLTKKVYYGIRYSDIEFDKSYFHDKICIFSDKFENGFKKYRANQNYNTKDFTAFYAYKNKEMDGWYNKNNLNYNIVFYNQNNAYELSKEIRDKAICYNNEEILVVLNDKIRMRKLLKSNKINTIPYCVFNGSDINIKIIKKLYNYDKFVIQQIHGGGGVGTYLFDVNSLKKNLNLFRRNGRYILSKYIPQSISVNTHICVTENSNLVMPGSIQLVEKIDNQLLYRGADFIAYRELPLETREKIRLISIKIANLLRKNGYKGIAGVDFVIDANNKIYCSEINPRFQASSIVISQHLKSQDNNTNSKSSIKEAKSIFEINEDAFNDIVKTSISYYDEINYSCYFYYNDANLSYNDIKCKLNIFYENLQLTNDDSKIIASIGEDSFSEFDNSLLNKKSYLFRVIFKEKIAQISPDHTLWINDNIKIQNLPDNDLKLKISLVNQGVRVSRDELSSKYKKAVFGGIDYKIIEKQMYINSPTGFGLSLLSPYEIKVSNNKHYLYYYTNRLYQIDVESDKLDSIKIKSKSDTNIKDIIYISTDRMRVKAINGCDLKSCGAGCKFCELCYSKKHFSIDEIESALKYSKSFQFRHILIGGGTDLSNNSWDNIIQIIKLIKKTIPDKEISLMSIPAPNNMLKQLKASGVKEVVFNVEIYDKNLASYYMPGKRDNNFAQYYFSLKKSIDVFGIGNVRSSFIVGLEKTESLLEGIEKICKIKVIPSLSIFRLMPNTITILNPTNEYLEKIYYEVLKITDKYNLYIGPNCSACKNNMLAI